MPRIKYLIADLLRQRVPLPADSPFSRVVQVWTELQIVAGMYAEACDARRDDGEPLVTVCSCGGGSHYQTDGNLFHVLLVEPAQFQKIRDRQCLPADLEERVTAALLATTHPAADVLAVCRGTLDLWHVEVERSVYVPRQRTHTVREA